MKIKQQSLWLARSPKVCGSISHGDSDVLLSYPRDKTKNTFPFYFAMLKIYHLSYSVYKLDTCLERGHMKRNAN